MAGAGVTIEGINKLVSQTGITEIHMGSGVRREGSFDHPADSQLIAQAKHQLLLASQQFMNSSGMSSGRINRGPMI